MLPLISRTCAPNHVLPAGTRHYAARALWHVSRENLLLYFLTSVSSRDGRGTYVLTGYPIFHTEIIFKQQTDTQDRRFILTLITPGSRNIRAPCKYSGYYNRRYPGFRILGSERRSRKTGWYRWRELLQIRTNRCCSSAETRHHRARVFHEAVEIDDTETFVPFTGCRVLSLFRFGSVVLRKVTFTLTPAIWSRAYARPMRVHMPSTTISPMSDDRCFVSPVCRAAETAIAACGRAKRFSTASPSEYDEVNHTSKNTTWLAKMS